jgi:hypothetical protein
MRDPTLNAASTYESISAASFASRVRRIPRSPFLDSPQLRMTKLLPRYSFCLCVLLHAAILLALGPNGLAAEDQKQASPPERDARWEPLAPGLQYRHEARQAGPLSIHVLRLDRGQRWNVHSALGQGTVFGLEPLDAMVCRTSKALGKEPLAAINGDFFVIKPGPYQGDPRGIQITSGELVSRPAGNSFWISASGEPRIGEVRSRLRVIWPDGRRSALGLNEARADDAAVLYTPTLAIRPGDPGEGDTYFLYEARHRPLVGRGRFRQKAPITFSAPSPTTRTRGGRELVLEQCPGGPWLPMEAGKTYTARVREVRETGSSPVVPGRLVLSIGPKLVPGLAPVATGDVVRLVMETTPDLAGVATAIGAGRVLVKDGKTPGVGPAKQPRHPRSMIGYSAEHIFLFVIDGRQERLSIGMTYPEMAALAGEYGCANATELDGGGSSTLWARGRVWNSPSDGKVRAIANGLIFFRQIEVNSAALEDRHKSARDGY